MSLYYAVGFVREFVHVCETGFAIYLEKWETQSMLIASPLAPRSTCCAAAIWWCSAEICSVRGRQRAASRLALAAVCPPCEEAGDSPGFCLAVA